MERELEAIFSHAVALDQSGHMRNTIFCGGKDVYILNYDKTVLLKFEISNAVKPFVHPVGFNANDYDSSKFYEENGKIVFSRSGAGFDRKKSCAVPGKSFEEVQELYKKYWQDFVNVPSWFDLNKEVLGLLEENLSHVELLSEDKKLVIIQRDIYAGSVSRLERQPESGLKLLSAKDSIKEDFGPVGLRTNDLIALFAFNKEVRFRSADSLGYYLVQGMETTMTGIVAWCLYDEMGNIQEVLNYGRQEQENRRSEQAVNRPTCKTRRKI